MFGVMKVIQILTELSSDVNGQENWSLCLINHNTVRQWGFISTHS